MKRGSAIWISLAVFAAAVLSLSAQEPPQQGGNDAAAADVYGGVQPRVKGLEKDGRYMDLLVKELAMGQREDSLNNVIAGIRDLFRTDPDNRRSHAERIMQLENEVFDLRSRIGAISFEIGAIEQEFILANLDSLSRAGDRESRPGAPASAGEEYSDLVSNPFFRDNLPPEDYRALLDAQREEVAMVSYLDIYRVNYDNMKTHAAAYARATDAQQADSAFVHYDELRGTNERVADTVGAVWSRIFDNKIYAYNFLLDKMNERNLLKKLGESAQRMRARLAEERPGAMSEEVAAYVPGKTLLLEYETTLAELLGYRRSLDSLSDAGAALRDRGYDFPAIDFRERFFLDFADIETSAPPKYNTRNPIPATKVHERGIIYRILVGSYPRVQTISVFKGLHPLGFVKEGTRYRYYAGGFENAAAAAKGLAKVKKLGFKDAKIAVWNFGDYSEMDDKPAAAGAGTMYRVELSGVPSPMPAAVKECIETHAPGKDVARTAGGFSVGLFGKQTDAAALMDAVSALDPAITVVIAEIRL